MGQKTADQNRVFQGSDFVYGPGIDEPVCMIIPAGEANAGMYFYYYDGLGSAAALVNTSGTIVEGYTYNVFGWHSVNYTAGPDGNWLTPDGYTSGHSQYGNPYMFTGRQYDPESSLYYYRARMYSPFLGRFMQTDPIGYADSMNLYQYCGNNPVNFIDPWGLWGKPQHYTMTYMAFRSAGFSHHDAQIAAKASRRVDNNLLAHSGWISSRHYLKGQEKSAEQRIEKLLRAAVSAEQAAKRAAQEGDYAKQKREHLKALRYLGRAAHTRQDQYSHAEQEIDSNQKHFTSGTDPDNIAEHPEEYKDAYEATEDLLLDFKAENDIINASENVNQKSPYKK